MFLAQQITVFNIYFENITLPYRSQPVFTTISQKLPSESLENSRR
jgi:hypothetical protein